MHGMLLRLLVLVSISFSVCCWSVGNFLNRRGQIVIFHSNTRNANNTATIHSHFMGLALEQARKAGRKGEVPIGAVIVEHLQDNDVGDENGRDETFRVVAQAHNLVETRHDASAHAELLALQLAGRRLGNWRLLNTTLYTTLEPCPMCLAACQAFRIHTIVYAAPDIKLGAIDSHIRLLDIRHPMHAIGTVVRGIRDQESAELLRDFFRQRRKAAKVAKGNSTQSRRMIPNLFRKRQ
jgi:tRNA(adenine34) deaminase